MSCHEITIRDRKVEYIDGNLSNHGLNIYNFIFTSGFPIKWTNNRYIERLVHECEDQVISQVT